MAELEPWDAILLTSRGFAAAPYAALFCVSVAADDSFRIVRIVLFCLSADGWGPDRMPLFGLYWFRVCYEERGYKSSAC